MNININEILFIIILFIFYLCLIKYKKKNNNNKENIPNNIIIPSNNIIFDYNELEYKNHKDLGFNNGILYNNSWIQNIDPITNKPIYKSRYDIEKFYETKSRFTYDVKNDYEMNGVIDPTDKHNGKSIKDIYDSSFIDYKKKTPIKNMITNNINESSIEGASNLSVLIPDTWIYEDENPENGGLIKDGLYAFDNELLQQNAQF